MLLAFVLGCLPHVAPIQDLRAGARRNEIEQAKERARPTETRVSKDKVMKERDVGYGRRREKERERKGGRMMEGNRDLDEDGGNVVLSRN